MARSGYHDPVLLNEVLERLPENARFVMDGTLGHGGHSAALLQRVIASEAKQSMDRHLGILPRRDDVRVVGVDRDVLMLQKAQERLKEFSAQMVYVHGSYADFPMIVEQSGVPLFDGMLLDIGVNMEHFKDAERGFSIKHDGPLDMRFDTSKGVPASEYLFNLTPAQFHEMLQQRTDFSPKRIEHLVMSFRATDRTFATTDALSARAKSIKMNDKGMAVFFQAIRIAVNDELGEFGRFLGQFADYLAPGGRCIVLTYHSIEDRMAKLAFKTLEESGCLKILTKHVITPSRPEKQKNPAARSAKMRVVERS